MHKPINKFRQRADSLARSIIASGSGKSGGGGGGGGTKEDPNTLISVQYARVMYAVCEGEIEGLVDGLRSVYLNKTPLLASGGGTPVTKKCDYDTGNKLIGLTNQSFEELNGLEVGMLVSGTGIPLGAKIISIHTEGPGYFFAIDRDPSSTVVNGTLTFQNSAYANFNNFSFYYRYGTQDQGPLPGFNSVETPIGNVPQVPIEQAAPLSMTITDPAANAVRVSITIPMCQTQKIEGSNVFIRGSRVQYAIDVKNSGGSYVERVVDVIEGKCTSPYIVSHRVELDTGLGPFDIRVRRVTADATDQGTVNKIYWHSLISIVDLRLNYPNTAMFAGVFDARQFSSIPAASFHLKLLKIRIPTNYDPITRVYATTGPGTSGGIWDGTFKVEWSDNPAWVFYDVITNERYGLGSFVSEAATDKYQLYEIAQYCDELVPDGYGGTEPRFACNLFIQNREEAFRVIANLASIFRGMVYWAGGKINFFQDRPSDPEFTFNQTNVVKGLFNYSGTAGKTRHNQAIVWWNDPDDFSERKPELVQDREAIRDMGAIHEIAITAFGCTSRGQARRVGRWALYSEQYETETVTFETSLDGTSLYPGMVINVLDPNRAGLRMGGRLMGATTTGLTLDSSITMVSGKSYTAILQNSDGQLVLRPLTNAAATVTSVSFAIPLPGADVPLVNSVWGISVTDLVPQQFRVLMVSESSATTFKVAALAYNSGKYDYVEDNIPFDDLPISQLPKNTAFVAPPTDVTIQEEFDVALADLERQFSVSWTHSTDVYLKDYTVEYRGEESNWVALPNTNNSSLTFRVRQPGGYTVRVKANNIFGRSSQWAYAYKDLPTDVLLPGAVTGLELFGQGNDTIFEGKDPHFVWRYNSPDTVSDNLDGATISPLFDAFIVEIYDARPTVPVLLRREEIVDSSYIYQYSNNFVDTGGNPTREIKVKVAMRDLTGKLSRAAQQTFTNPAPLIGSTPPTIDTRKLRISTRAGFFNVNYDRPTDSDFEGLMIFVSTDPTFALSDVRAAAGDPPTAAAMVPYNAEDDTGMLLYRGRDASITLPLPVTETYYLIFAPYDAFGDEDIYYYGPMTTNIDLTIDTTPPETPTGLVVTTESTIDKDGSQRAIIRAKWDPNDEEDLSEYGWWIRRVSGTPAFDINGNLTGYGGTTQSYQAITGGTYARTASGGYVHGPDGKVTVEWIVEPDAWYEVKINAIDTSANASSYTSLTEDTVIRAAQDTQAPAAPTFVSATTDFRFVKLVWNANTEKDLFIYRLWQSETNNFAAATMIRETATTTANVQFPFVGQLATTSYYFFLTAVDNTGNESDPSASITATLPEISAPTGLTLTTGVEIDADGTQRVWVDASWTNSATVEVINYTVEIATVSETANVERRVSAQTKTRFWVTGNTVYYIRVRANDANAGYSGYTAESTITSAKDTTPPSAPTSFVGVSAIRTNFLSFAKATALDLAYTRIYRNTVNTAPTIGVTVPYAEVNGTTFVDSNVVQNTAYYYWASSIDTSGNESAAVAMSPTSITPGQVATSDIATFAVDLTKMYHATIALANDSWTNNSPSAGHIAWNSHTLYYQGNAYTIAAGDTSGVAANAAWVWWNSASPTLYQVAATNPNLTDGQFMIATNVNGAHDLAWNAMANALIGTAYIQNLAVTNAKIYDLAVDKLTAGTITAQEIIIAGGTSGILRSDNYSAGSAGWKIDGSGKGYFMDVVIKGGVTVGTPGSSGLYLGADKIGYFNGSVWTSYINSSGDLILGSKLSYTAGTGVLFVDGYIQVGGAAGDVNAGVTTISGGKITTGTIDAAQLVASLVTTKELVLDYASGTGGIIRSAGATAYATGSGFWIRKTATNVEFRFGTPGGQEIKWDGTDLTLTGAINITGLSTLATVATSGSYADLASRPINQATGSLLLAPAPSGSGLFLGNSHMGYYAGGAWKTYIDSSGNFKMVGSSGTLEWNGSALYIGTGNFNNTNTAFYVDHNGQFSLKNKLVWDGSTLDITGTLEASTIGSGGLYVSSVIGLRYIDDNGVFTITGGGDNGYAHGGQIDLQGTGLNNGNAGCVVISAGNHADGQIHFRTSDTLRGLVKRNGTWELYTALTALSLTATSARRFKRNIRPLEDSLKLVKQLNGRRFDWDTRNITNDIGVIAEEVEQVFPTLVSYDDDGQVQGVQYGKLTAVLIEAVKELAEEVRLLKPNRLGPR